LDLSFLRLISTGIYPREPRKKKKVAKGATSATTFYYAKDIQYLLHEPLLNKFREHKALAKKVARALGRNEVGDAVRLEKARPRMSLDHIIKERYPTFIDALRDMDDALSMIFLFANLPSTSAVPYKRIALCQRLSLEFQHYLIVTHSLKKSFLSIKGIYYQATIQGQDVMWLVPYRFVQKMTGDIDFRVMGTFIEFYTTLIGFVNYRLYNTIGLVYPPKFDAASDERGAELGAFKLEGKGYAAQQAVENGANGHVEPKAISAAAQAEADKVALLPTETDDSLETEEAESEEDNDAIDKFEPATVQDADILPQPQPSGSEVANLFSEFTFFLSRETPKAPLEFILKAFGCKRIGWDPVTGEGAYTTDETDPTITHQILDRPYVDPTDVPVDDEEDDDGSGSEAGVRPPQPIRVPGRIYVQPQWVWDCINQGKLIRPDLYAPGASLPPHLSPWAKPTAGTYDPTVSLEDQQKAGEDELHEEDDATEKDVSSGAEEEVTAAANKLDKIKRVTEGDSEEDEIEAGEGMDVGETESDEEEEVAAVPAKASSKTVVEIASANLSDDEEERDQYQRELEAEAKGQPIIADAGSKKKSEARKTKERKVKEDAEELERQRMMMTNKKRKIFDKMHKGNVTKEAEAEKLRKKRRRLEKELKKGKSA
jgi:pescadillo protein